MAKRPKYEVDYNLMYSVLKVVFALTINIGYSLEFYYYSPIGDKLFQVVGCQQIFQLKFAFISYLSHSS